MIGVIAHLIIVVVGYLASLLFPDPDHAKRELTVWGWWRQQRQQSLQEISR